jgi:DNA mismatch repair protein MutS2
MLRALPFAPFCGIMRRMIDIKHAATLELPKVLDRLAGLASFSAGIELCRQLAPSTMPVEVKRRLAVTAEARRLLTTNADVSLGGIHDVRPFIEQAARGAALMPQDLLDIRETLAAGRDIHRTLARLANLYPLLSAIAARIVESAGVIAEIGRCIDDHGQVRDEASPQLADIRRELRLAHDRLQDKLARVLTSQRNAPYLQDALITMRDGRYVIPIKSDFKGRIPGIVHDQSQSGATLFIEPIATVELNNRWRELQLKEDNEIRRILHALSNLVAEDGIYIAGTVQALAELDLASACAKYADEIAATEPRIPDWRPEVGGRRSEIGAPQSAIRNPQSEHPGSVLRLIQARHPLIDPQRVVPIDVEMDDATFIVVITGPNTGGKTVALKTVGLMCLMAYCGLHIPASAGSELCVFDHVFADIGDEQSIEQSLSTFSSHLANLKSFMSRADRQSLVLLDELGAGTDPAEGSALARAILDHLREKSVTTFVATHYPELKIWAHQTPGAVNASVEFDPETLAPTYRLIIGLPGRSNAFAIAARMGLDAHIVEAARAMVATSDLQAEDLLAGIHKARQEADAARYDAQRAKAEAEKMERDLRARLAGIEDERKHILEAAQDEMHTRLETLEEEIVYLRNKLKGLGAQELAALEERRRELHKKAAAVVPALPAIEQPAKHPINAGDVVWIERLKSEGTVDEIDGNKAQVTSGRLRLTLSVDELDWRKTPQPDTSAPAKGPGRIVSSPGMELDLRGERADDALIMLDRHLDAAFLSGLPFVRVIHGHGTGALKKAVRQALKGHPHVRDYEAGRDGEGGDGVTVVKLAQER